MKQRFGFAIMCLVAGISMASPVLVDIAHMDVNFYLDADYGRVYTGIAEIQFRVLKEGMPVFDFLNDQLKDIQLDGELVSLADWVLVQTQWVERPMRMLQKTLQPNHLYKLHVHYDVAHLIERKPGSHAFVLGNKGKPLAQYMPVNLPFDQFSLKIRAYVQCELAYHIHGNQILKPWGSDGVDFPETSTSDTIFFQIDAKAGCKREG